jgi:hypothetical protein
VLWYDSRLDQQCNAFGALRQQKGSWPRRTTGPLPFADAASSAAPPARRRNADDTEKADYRRSFEGCAVRHRSGFDMVPLQGPDRVNSGSPDDGQIRGHYRDGRERTVR